MGIQSLLFFQLLLLQYSRSFKYHLYTICACNHMFGRAIWDKLLEWIFENFELARVNRGQFQNFQNSRG